MQTIESLLSTAFQDTELLTKLDQDGDNFSRARDVDFVLKAEELKKAELIASFVSDNQYGVPSIEETEEGYRLIVTVYMPITQHVLCSVSGMMVCLAKLFSVEYDGWGCVVQRDT